MEKKVRTTLYFSEPFHSGLKQISEREHESMGQIIEERLASFVQLHLEDNNQQTIPRYVKEGKAYIAPDTRFLKCPFHTWYNGEPACMWNKRLIRLVGLNYEQCVDCNHWRQ